MRGIDFSKIEDLEKFAKIPKDERDSLVDKDRIEAEKLNIKIDKEKIQSFKDRLQEIIQRRPSIDISGFFGNMMTSLVSLSNEIIEEYQRKNKSKCTGKELEDKAYSFFSIDSIGKILDDIKEKIRILNDADVYIEQRILHSNRVITPPGTLSAEIITGSRAGFERAGITIRLKTLLYVLKENGTEWDNIITTDGIMPDNSVRQLSYYSIIISELNRFVLICDEEWNASYIFDLKKVTDLNKSTEEVGDMTKQEKDEFIINNLGIGVRIIESSRWMENIKRCLYQDLPIKGESEENTNTPQVEKEGEWKGFYLDPKTNMHYGTIAAFIDYKKISLDNATLQKAIDKLVPKINSIKIRDIVGRPNDNAYPFEVVINTESIKELINTPQVEKAGEWKGFYFDPKTKMHYASVGTLSNHKMINLTRRTVQNIINTQIPKINSIKTRDLAGNSGDAYPFEVVIKVESLKKLIDIPRVETKGEWKGFYYDPKTNIHYGITKILAQHKTINLDKGALQRTIDNLVPKINSIKIRDLTGKPKDAYPFEEITKIESVKELINSPQVEKEGEWKGFYYDPKTDMHYGAIGTFVDFKKINLENTTLQKMIVNFIPKINSIKIRDLTGKPGDAYPFEDVMNIESIKELINSPQVEKEGEWKGFYYDPKTKMHYGAIGTFVNTKKIIKDYYLIQRVIKETIPKIISTKIKDLSGKPQDAYPFEEVIKRLN